jgi:homoserine dehydrogenase
VALIRPVNVGIVGWGTIGSGVAKALLTRGSLLEKRAGVEVKLKVICDKDIASPRNYEVDKNLLTTDLDKTLNDPEIDIIVELIGGIHPAKEIILKALQKKKNVVTANKALLSDEKDEIFQSANENDVDIYFEASVGGGIPIIKALREGLISNRIQSIFGIINGTSNYILTRMADGGCEFKTALAEAQQKGYAEKDPSLDIKGIDSAHKLAILASLGFGKDVRLSDIYVEGITDVSLSDIVYANELGCVLKLLAITKKIGDEMEARVCPTLLPKEHLLSSVKGVYNAIYVNGDLTDDIVLYGQGAGQSPTTSAVVSDIIDIARNIKYNSHRRVPTLVYDHHIHRIRPIDETETRYYIRFSVIDRPGVFANLAGCLGKHGISIASVIQKERKKEQIVPVVMLTHEAKESSIRGAMSEIDALPVIRRKSVVIRMEKEE